MRQGNGLAQFGHCFFDSFNAGPEFLGRRLDRLMLHPPDWFEGGRVVREAGDEVPVDVGELVAEEFVVDLPGLIDLAKSFGDQVHFFHQLHPLRGGQLEEFCCMAFEDDDCPAGKELIVMEIGFGQSEVGDGMVGARPGALAGFARRVGHG